MSCATKLLSASKELHDYIREKAGIDYNEATGEGKQEWIKAAKDLQEHSVKSLNDIYADLKIKGFEKTAIPKEEKQSTVSDFAKKEVDTEIENTKAAIEAAKMDEEFQHEGVGIKQLNEDLKILQTNPVEYFARRINELADDMHSKNANLSKEEFKQASDLQDQYQKIYDDLTGNKEQVGDISEVEVPGKQSTVVSDKWNEGDVLQADYPRPKVTIKKILKTFDDGKVKVEFDNGTQGLLGDKKSYIESTKSNNKEVVPSKIEEGNKSLTDAINDYEVNHTNIGKLVEDVEAIADETGNEKLKDAVKYFRDEQEYDRSISGRHDMTMVEDNFLSKIKESEPKPITNKEVIPERTVEEIPPKPPVNGNVSEAENPTTVLSFKGLQEVADEFGLNDVTSRDRKTDVQLFKDSENTISKWVEDGAYSKNIEKLVKAAESKEVLTDEQRIIVQQHLANVRNAAKEAREKFGINSKEFNDALLELKRVNNAGIATRSAAGAALRVGDIQSIARYDVPDMMTAKMEALNVNELTEAQKVEIEKRSKEIESKLKTAEEKVALYEAEIAKYKAEAALNKAAKTTTTKNKITVNKTHNEFVAERQTLKDKLKKQVDEYKAVGQRLGITPDGGAESFILTAKMAKTIGEIVKSHVEEVGNKLSEVTKRTFNDVKDFFEGISEKDIHDVIAGKYNEPQKTKSQLQVDLKDLQDEAKLIDKLNNLEKGGIPKTEKEKIKRNQQIKDLQDKIKEHDITKLSQIKERNKAATNKIKERITKGEFDKEPEAEFLDSQEMKKRFPKEYKEATDAIIAKDNAKHDFEVELYRDALKKRGKGERFFDGIKDVIGTSKALRAGIDFSALMIQNIVPIMSHPIENAPNIAKSFRDFASRQTFERRLAELHNSKYWDLIQKSGLDVTEPKSVEAKNKEEIFNRNLIEKDITIAGKKFNIGKYTTAPFERAFTSLGNNIRVSAFLRVAEKLERDGYTFENNPEIFKNAARLFNTQTGRGTLPDFMNKSSEIYNTVFWSPRLMASRLNLLGLGDIANPLLAKRGGFYRSLGEKGQGVSYLQKRAALDMVKFIGGVIGTYAAASFMFGAKADLNPTSVTFGNLKDDDSTKSYNMFGGFSQYIKIMAILAVGAREIGKKREDISDAKGKSRADVGLKFFRGKVTPAMSVAIDLLDKKDYLGRPLNTKEELLNLVSPLSLSNIPDDIKRDGLVPAFVNGLISVTGINVTDSKDFKKKK